MASTQLNKSVQKNANTDAITKMTFSAWIKRSALGEATIFAAHQLSTYYTHFYFNNDDALMCYSYINSSTAANVVTKRFFRDTNCWYHIMLVVDTTLATTNDRIKFYVNGVRETEMDGSQTHPSQNSGFGQFNDTGATLNIGNTANRAAFSGLMSHVHYTPYTAYDASAFGSTDSTTGEWQITTAPSVTYSTAGFFILKDGNSVTDQSGNSNNFTVGGGTFTKTEDCPSNVFATGNPLIGVHSNGNTLVPTFSNGNNTATANGSAWRIFKSTLGASSGKYYAEFKWISDSNTRYAYVGIYDEDDYAAKATGYPYVGDMANGHAYYSENGNYYTNGGSTSFGSTFSNGSIIGVAMDLDNSKIYFSKDGAWQGSGNPTNGTGGKALTADKIYTFGLQIYAVGSIVYSANFGNGYFGTTAVSSAGTNASGIGIFEYDVPANFTALSTKGLNL